MIYNRISLWKRCETCERMWTTNGHFVKHKSGAVTAYVYNMESRCHHCRAKEQEAEEAKQNE